MDLSTFANLLTAMFTGFGLWFVWRQLRQQTIQGHAERVLDLYSDLDIEEARTARRFVYKEFPNIKTPNEDEINIVRDVLASMDRMSYQVIRGFADRKAAYDLYGSVLIRVVFSVYDWLQEERKSRGEPKNIYYARYAEQLSYEFARKYLHDIGCCRLSYRKLENRNLLLEAIKRMNAKNMTALQSESLTKQVTLIL